jgi:hypothetical protein
LVQDWNSIESLWLAQHYPLRDLKDTSPLWARFVLKNPSVANPVLTSSQASAAFNAEVGVKLAAAAAFFGPQFYLLDRDPQIALVDTAFHVPDITEFKDLASQIQGNEEQATNYTSAAKQVNFGAAAPGSLRRMRDDQQLMKHGADASSIILGSPNATLYAGQVTYVVTKPIGAFGKSIILPPSELKWTTSVRNVVTVKRANDGINLTGVHAGTTTLDLIAGPASTSASCEIAVLPSGVINWQATNTSPDVDGTFSTSAKIHDGSYWFGPHGPLTYGLAVTAIANGSQEQLGLSLDISGLPSPIQIASYGATAVGATSITLGTNVIFSDCIITITSLNPKAHFIAGTFTGTPGDQTSQPGSISGSFAGIYAGGR